MGEVLQHQNSMVAFEKHNSRCSWSWLQIFNSHHHQSSRQLLQYPTHEKGAKVPKIYVPLPAKQHENWASEPNFLVGNKGKLKKSSSNAILKGLSKILFKNQFQKPKVLLPAKQRLQRTNSIHHWECNDYVLPEDNINSADIADSDENFPFIQRCKRCDICRSLDVIRYIESTQNGELKARSTDKETIRIQKLLKVWESLLKRKGGFGGNVALQSRDFITMLELLDVHKDLFLKILKDPRFSMENILKDLHLSSSKKSFVKSGSFPLGISSKGNAQSSKHNHGWVANFDSINNAEENGNVLDTQNSEPATDGTCVTCSTSETLSEDSEKLRNQEEDEVDLSHIREIFEHIINETKKEHSRISKDAVMHKIPYGQKMTEENVGASNLFRSNSDRSYNDRLRYKASAPSAKYQERSVRRSRSLSDSLDRYSNLLASITTKESKALPHSLSSSKDYNTSQNAVSLEPLERSVSSIDVVPRRLNKEIRHELFDGSVSSVADIFRENKQSFEVQGLDYVNSVDTCDEMDDDVPSITATDRCVPDRHNELSFLPNRTELKEQRHTAATAEAYAGSFNLRRQMAAVLETFLSDDEGKKGESTDIPDSKTAGNEQTTLDEQEDKLIVRTDYEAIEPSPISALDLYIEGDVDSSANYMISEEENSLLSLHRDESTSQHHKSDFDALASVDASESTTIRQESLSSNHTEAISTRGEYENELNYVRTVLKQFSFRDSELLLAGSSLYQLGHFEQSLVSSSDYEEPNVDQKLLTDLTDEALSEIYEKSFASMWFSRNSCQLRRLPVGDHLVSKVWDRIHSYLISQAQTFDNIVAMELAKNDKWLNYELSAESLGSELSDIILDHMLEELILEFDDV